MLELDQPLLWAPHAPRPPRMPFCSSSGTFGPALRPGSSTGVLDPVMLRGSEGRPGTERPCRNEPQLFQLNEMRFAESPSHVRSSGSDHRLPLLLAMCILSIWNAACAAAPSILVGFPL